MRKRKKFKIFILCALVLLIIVSTLGIINSVNSSDILYNSFVRGKVLAISSDSFVIQNELSSDYLAAFGGQSFYVFKVYDDTVLWDYNGVPIIFSDLKTNMNIEVMYERFDTTETYEVLCSEIKILGSSYI